ncbi:unnamed protein product [Arabidopsis thaliana]|uniref:(thale cress) hypothetical protein n=1 Tax=Arabidopsis thaliana TaxID=3702 RepID=A0A7G2EPY0_ARATH|nr:unnamed protein product [Arabidopsis thaliana]
MEGDDTLPPISIPKKKLSGVHKKHIVDRKKKLGVKFEAPKSKQRYSTCSKPELKLSDDEKSRLLIELQTKVEELSNRVMKLEKTRKAVRFKRYTKLSSSFVACSSRSKRKKTMNTSSQSHTLSEHVFGQQEVGQQVPNDNLDQAKDSSDSTPLTNTHSNKADANEGNLIYDTDVKDPNANEEDVDSKMQVDPSSNQSVEKLLPLNQDHIIDDSSERVPAIHSGLDLPKEHNSEEQQSNANEADVDSKIPDSLDRDPASHSDLDLAIEQSSKEEQAKDSLDRDPASHSDLDLPIEQSSEEQQAKDNMEAAQHLIHCHLGVGCGISVIAMVIYSHPIYDTNSKPDKQSEFSPTHSANIELTPTKDQITDSRDIGGHDLDDNQEEGYVAVSDSSPAREREKPILSEAEVFLVAELLSKSKSGSYELLPSMNLYEEDEVQRFIEPVVTILPYLIQRYCKPECSQNHSLQPFHWKRLDGLYKNYDLVTLARWQ